VTTTSGVRPSAAGAPGGPGAAVFSVSFNRETKATRGFDLPQLEAELRDRNVFSWIDIQGAEIGPLNDVLGRLGIDLKLVSHFDEPEILPRIVERSDCLALYLYEVEDPELHLDTSRGLRELQVERMILVLGDDFVLTYHRTELDCVNYVKEVCGESFRLWGKTQGFIAFLFLMRCLYDYAHLNLANDNYIDRLEEAVLGGDPERLAQDISVAGGNILTLKKLAASLHIVLMLLATKRNIYVSEEARHFYQEMLQNAVSVRAAVDSSRDLLDGVVGATQARAQQRTSDIARVLTVVSAVILPLTLVAGIYGMNFRHMPELEVPWAYYAVLILMAALGLALIGAFWRMGWLKGMK
jgi:magnesium transporter